MEMFSLGKSEKIFQIKKFLQYNCLFFRIIYCELLRRFTTETFLFEIFFHFSPIKTFPFGLILMGHISVFQVNDPKSMNFFYNFNIFRISCEVIMIEKNFSIFFFQIFRENGTHQSSKTSTIQHCVVIVQDWISLGNASFDFVFGIQSRSGTWHA